MLWYPRDHNMRGRACLWCYITLKILNTVKHSKTLFIPQNFDSVLGSRTDQKLVFVQGMIKSCAWSHQGVLSLSSASLYCTCHPPQFLLLHRPTATNCRVPRCRSMRSNQHENGRLLRRDSLYFHNILSSRTLALSFGTPTHKYAGLERLKV